MVHNVTSRGTRSYRYYTCVKAIKCGRKHCPTGSLPAGEIEAAVVEQIRGVSSDVGLRREVLMQSEAIRESHHSPLEANDIALAFANFDNVWESLNSREQAKALKLLISRVEFDVADCSLAVTFYPSAMKGLTDLSDSNAHEKGLEHSINEPEQKT